MPDVLPNHCATPEARSRRAALHFWSVLALVLLAEAVAILAFYGFDWSGLRQLHVLWLHTTLQALGCPVQTSLHSLTVNGRAFQISPDCTYVDLILCGLPLLWRVRRRWSANLAVLAAYATAVALVNLARVLYGVYAFAHGVSLFWSHDVVDYILWYPTLGVVALFWLRSLFPPPSRREATLTQRSAFRDPHSALDPSLAASAAPGTAKEAAA
jgi:hypothetical protein